MLLLWIPVFIASLAVLIKAADWFTKGAEIAGLKLNISPFIIGVTIVSIGTSLPELVTSFIAISKGEAAIVVANAVGSNIANILLVVGLAAVFAGALTVRRSLIDLDAPLLAISTALLLGILWDKQVVFIEAIVLLITYIIYVAYTVRSAKVDGEGMHEDDVIAEDLQKKVKGRKKSKKPSVSWGRALALILVGAAGVYFGADWVIRSVIQIGTIAGISSSVIAITAIAFGTSLPELVVSISAARKGSYEVALGNVFGSNIFNSLVVIGLPGVFTSLPVDSSTFAVGLFFMTSATILYVFSGISKKIHNWEGLMYLMLYVLFVVKVFAGKL